MEVVHELPWTLARGLPTDDVKFSVTLVSSVLKLGEEEGSIVNWITCPECGAKIGIIISVGRVVPKAEKPQAAPRISSLSDIKDRLARAGVDLSLVEFDEVRGSVVIKPNRFLGDLWRPIHDAVRGLGGVWIRDGRSSRWEIKMEGKR